VYNLANGVSSVAAEEVPATMNADLGQQWGLPTTAITFEAASVPKQTIKIEVKDVDQVSYGTFLVELDAATVSADCSSGKWASVTRATGKPPVQ
jgi:hypothetical protein